MPAFRISQYRFLSKLVGANSHGKPLSFLSTPRENWILPTRATREQRPSRTSAAHFASGSCPWENYGAIDSKVTFRMPPAEPFARTFASPREWLHHERSVPPRTDLSPRGFVASPYEEPFASAKRPTTCEWPLPGVKGHK